MNVWISVEEEMPTPSHAVIVWCPERKNHYGAYWRVVKDEPEAWVLFGGGWNDRINETVTHWTYMPAPPVDTQEAA